MIPSVCYKENQNRDIQALEALNYPDMDTQALAALDGANDLLIQVELEVTEEIIKTKEMAQHAFKEMKGQFAALLEENRKLREQKIMADSQQRQLKITYEGEIAAWKEKCELSDKSIKDIRQKMAKLSQQTYAEKKALIQEKNDAVKIAREVNEARVDAIKQQFNANLGDVFFPEYNHSFNIASLRSMSTEVPPYCSCHKRDDPNNYYYSVYAKWKSHYLNRDEMLYEGERQTRAALAGALLKNIESMEKISS